VSAAHSVFAASIISREALEIMRTPAPASAAGGGGGGRRRGGGGDGSNLTSAFVWGTPPDAAAYFADTGWSVAMNPTWPDAAEALGHAPDVGRESRLAPHQRVSYLVATKPSAMGAPPTAAIPRLKLPPPPK
jgi:hypothetical protein